MSRGKYDGKALHVFEDVAAGQAEHYETCVQEEEGGVVQISCPIEDNTLPMPEIVVEFGIKVGMVEVVDAEG